MSLKELQTIGLFSQTPKGQGIQITIDDTLDICNRTLKTLYDSLGPSTLESCAMQHHNHRPSN